jgi:hypothetical protein
MGASEIQVLATAPPALTEMAQPHRATRQPRLFPLGPSSRARLDNGSRMKRERASCTGAANIGSRMTREGHVRFWERAGVRSPRATRQVFIRIRGKQHYLGARGRPGRKCSRHVVQSRRSATAAKRFFRKLPLPAPPSSPECQPASCGSRCRLSHMARGRRSCARINNLQSCHFGFQHPLLGNLTTTAEGSRTSMRSGAPTPLDELSSLYGPVTCPCDPCSSRRLAHHAYKIKRFEEP